VSYQTDQPQADRLGIRGFECSDVTEVAISRAEEKKRRRDITETRETEREKKKREDTDRRRYLKAKKGRVERRCQRDGEGQGEFNHSLG
jgi:hypothetical protein